MNRPYTIKDIKKMSYTDFVGLVNQWNVPPGSYNTLTSWINFGNVTEESNILELACTTGFSCREIALMTGAKAYGIDISEASIKAALHNKKQYASSAKLDYEAVDALQFNPQEKYSHVIVGAALRFFPDPATALARMKSLLVPGGKILSSEFYCSANIPQSLVEDARDVFDITVTQYDYKQVMSAYSNLTLIHEERHELFQETDDELAHYCNSTIARFANDNPDYDTAFLETMHHRLLNIKHMSNRLRPYQRYNVLVHIADPRYYPHRYTELF